MFCFFQFIIYLYILYIILLNNFGWQPAQKVFVYFKSENTNQFLSETD